MIRLRWDRLWGYLSALLLSALFLASAADSPVVRPLALVVGKGELLQFDHDVIKVAIAEPNTSGFWMPFSRPCATSKSLALWSKISISGYAIFHINAMDAWFISAGSRTKRKFPGGMTWIAASPVASPSRFTW